MKAGKYFGLNILAMIVVAIALVLITLKWLDVYTRHGEAVKVPDVRGLGVVDAERLLQKYSLTGLVSDSNYVKDQLPGSVLDVNPAIGQKVKKGRTIYLTVNTGNIPLYTVPDVADNSSSRQAQARIQAAGFKLTENEWIPGEKDWVYGVKYNGRELEAGDKVPVGATLTLIVGDGMKEPVLDGDSLNMDGEYFMGDDPTTPSGTEVSQEEESWF